MTLQQKMQHPAKDVLETNHRLICVGAENAYDGVGMEEGGVGRDGAWKKAEAARTHWRNHWPEMSVRFVVGGLASNQISRKISNIYNFLPSGAGLILEGLICPDVHLNAHSSHLNTWRAPVFEDQLLWFRTMTKDNDKDVQRTNVWISEGKG